MTWSFVNEPWFVWGALPALIFLAEVTIVSLSTIRIIFLSRGNKMISSFLGFFEIFIWLLAIGQIFQNLTNPLYYITYGLGFATGNAVGLWIEEKIAMGILLVRVITRKPATDLTQTLKKKKYRFTKVPAIGSSGKKVSVLYITVRRKNVHYILQQIKKYHPRSFFTLEDIRYVHEGAVSSVDPAVRRRFGFFRREK